MRTVRRYGWLVPLMIFGALAIATPINPWLLGVLALVSVAIMHLAASQIEKKTSRKSVSE